MIISSLKAQINLDFNTDELPEGWITQGSFAISDAEIHPICQQNSLIGSIFEQDTEFWLQTKPLNYSGGNIEIQMSFGIKDLYHALGVSNPFQKPNIYIQYSKEDSTNWVQHEEISLVDIEESANCIQYTTIINADLIQDFETIKFRFLYKSPLQTGTIYLLYWSIDKLKITIDTNCIIPPEPIGLENQSFLPNSIVSDIDVTGQNLKWYADPDLTQEISGDTLLENMVTYYVTQTIDGCESEALAITVQLILKVNDYGKDNLIIYPNPVKDVLNVSSSDQILTISIFNMLGQEILVKQVNNTITLLDVAVFPPGNYILKLTSPVGSKNVKVIKQ